MKDLKQIRKEIVASGSITSSDISALRTIVYSNGRVNKEEAEFLFQLRKELNDLGNLMAWDNFFIQAICDFILDDDRSPNAVDEVEATWLIEQIGEDGVIDDVEERLLKRLSKEAKNFPNNLKEIQSHTNIARKLGRKIFLLLCGNTKTMRSMQYGVTKTGNHKVSVHHIRTNIKSDDDDHEA